MRIKMTHPGESTDQRLSSPHTASSCRITPAPRYREEDSGVPLTFHQQQLWSRLNPRQTNSTGARSRSCLPARPRVPCGFKHTDHQQHLQYKSTTTFQGAEKTRIPPSSQLFRSSTAELHLAAPSVAQFVGHPLDFQHFLTTQRRWGGHFGGQTNTMPSVMSVSAVRRTVHHPNNIWSTVSGFRHQAWINREPNLSPGASDVKGPHWACLSQETHLYCFTVLLMVIRKENKKL